jgi:hypothetical protein
MAGRRAPAVRYRCSGENPLLSQTDGTGTVSTHALEAVGSSVQNFSEIVQCLSQGVACNLLERCFGTRNCESEWESTLDPFGTHKLPKAAALAEAVDMSEELLKN